MESSAWPWPDRPEISEYVPGHPPELDDDEAEPEWESREPSAKDIADEDTLMLRRQRLFRWAAESIARALSEVAEVAKVAAFGAVAKPLEREVPRFREYRRHGIEVLHECADLDLAVWMTGFEQLKNLKRTMNRGLASVQNTRDGGVAHHQVDVHLFEAGSGAYRGRLCWFGECPKPGKRECFVPHCGAQPFLRQFAQYRFQPARFESEPKVVLYER